MEAEKVVESLHLSVVDSYRALLTLQTDKKVNFVEGERVSQINGNASGIVAKDGWDPVSQLLKLKEHHQHLNIL